MRVLLTGAGGFIGAHAARALLERGAEVHAMVRESGRAARLTAVAGARVGARAGTGTGTGTGTGGSGGGGGLVVHEADVTDRAAVAKVIAAARPEICVHAAWYAVPGKYLDAVENLAHVAASLDLAVALSEAGCRRFVGVGTCFEYDTDVTAKLTESSATEPRFLYSSSKLALFELLSAAAANRDAGQRLFASFAWCRLFYQYGPTEDAARLVPAVIDKLVSGGVAETTGGEQVRDFLHVADVGAAIAAVALSDLEGAVNVGSGEPITVKRLVETIARLAGAEDRLRVGALPYRPGDPMYVCADVTKLKAAGFSPRFDLESGLADAIASRRTEANRCES